MATRFELVLEGDSEAVLGAVAEEALDELRFAEEAWSLFRPGSLLSRVNREAAERPVSLDEVTFELLREALLVSRISRGAFDPTVATLMHNHGFRATIARIALFSMYSNHVHHFIRQIVFHGQSSATERMSQ